MIFEDKGLEVMFGLRREGTRSGRRKLDNEEVHNFTLNQIRTRLVRLRGM
jgi:hypothetical protein